MGKFWQWVSASSNLLGFWKGILQQLEGPNQTFTVVKLELLHGLCSPLSFFSEKTLKMTDESQQPRISTASQKELQHLYVAV